MALREVDRLVVLDTGGGSGRKPLDEPLQGYQLDDPLWRVPVRDQPLPCLVPQLLGIGEGSVLLSEGQRPETAPMFLRMEAKPVPDGPGETATVS